MMLQVSLAVLVLIASIAGMRKFGAVSVVGVALFGMAVYSSPAIMGVTRSYEADTYLGPVSPEGVFAHLVAWATLLIFVLFAKRPKPVGGARTVHRRSLSALVWSAAIVSAVLYLAIAYRHSPLYFLEPRETEEITAQLVKIIWGWTSAIGFLAALGLRRKLAAIYFFAFLGMNFLAGDRTLAIIVFFASSIILFRGYRINALLRKPIIWALGVSVPAFAILAKPIYGFVKDGVWPQTLMSLDSRTLRSIASQYEPLVIHNTLELVIHNGFNYSVGEMARALFGQLLVVPSVFGFSSNAWNLQFETFIDLDLDFNVAYSFWGQGYSIAGYAGIAAFSAIFAGMVWLADRFSRGRLNAMRLLVVLLGALVGVYIYRNSLENLAAFVRQILIAFGLVYAGAVLLDDATARTTQANPATR